MSPDQLRIYSFLPISRANGPGPRATLWLQGCSLACPGCFNPATHPETGGTLVWVDELFQQLAALRARIQGITVSGGEPLQQLPALLSLLQRVRRETALSVLVFTGYSWQEVGDMPGTGPLLACTDVLIAGRYVARQHVGLGLRGSANKSVHFLTDRYAPQDLDTTPVAEVIINPQGVVRVSGIDPLRWGKEPAGPRSTLR
jgi:anaerobic ribonucleoside-triphosphate reductase activating protein